jgi:outer membrane protein
MRRLRSLQLAVAAVGLLLAAAQAQPKPAAPAPVPAPAAIGVADIDQVLSEYEEFDRMNREFKEFQNQQALAFEEQYAIRLLEAEERTEYVSLSSETSLPTTRNRARRQELLALSEKREQDLDQLRAKNELTPAEESYLKRLRDLEEQGAKQLAEFRRKLLAERETKQKDLNRQITEKIDRAIAEVANEKKLALVLSKPAVLYGGSDVTQAVLAKLNAGK